MIKVKLYGVFKDALPKKYHRGIKLDALNMLEVRSALDQFLPFNELLRDHPSAFLYGPRLKSAKPLPVEAVARGKIDGPMTIHIVPGMTVEGSEPISTTMIVTALITTAISIGISLLMSLIFPPKQPKSSKQDKRKSKLYESGLVTQREGVPLSYVAGERVLCGMNVIEASVDIKNSGKAQGTFTPGPAFTGSGAPPVVNPPATGDNKWSDIFSDGESTSTPPSSGGTTYPDDGYGGGGGTGEGWDTYQQFSARTAENVNLEGGGGKGGSSPPKMLANNSFSDATLRFLGAIGAGEIGGLVGSTDTERAESIIINEIPLKDASGYNWSGVTWAQKTGVAGQGALPITPGVTNNFDANIDLIYDNPSGARQSYPYTVSTFDVNRVKPFFAMSLLKVDSDDGDQHETSVTIQVETRREDGAWSVYGQWKFTGKSTDAFQRQVEVWAPPKDGTKKWEFRIQRMTPDSTDTNLLNTTAFKGWTEIIDKEYTYDGSEGEGFIPTALFGMAVDLSQFDANSRPDVGLICAGTKVRVPSMYVNGHHPGSGTWDGTWNEAVTDNPVWHWYHLATDDKIGAGIPESYFNKFQLAEIAKRCDETVTKNHMLGGVVNRRRYTLNKQITEDGDTWDVLTEIASSFRAVPYWNGSTIVLIQDAPTSTVNHYINNAMVEGGIFVHKPTPIGEKLNDAEIDWDNPDDFYRKAVLGYKDDDAIERNRDNGLSNGGRVTQRFYKYGCTNKHEAYDFGRELVYSAQQEDCSITFTVDSLGMVFSPGDIVAVTDWNRNGMTPLGRAIDVVSKTITFDNSYEFESGVNYTLIYWGTDGQTHSQALNYTGGSAGERTQVTVTGVDPKVYTPVTVFQTSGGVQPTLWKVMQIVETEPGKYEITGQKYDENKYTFLDTGVTIQPDDWTKYNGSLPVAQNLSAHGHVKNTERLGIQYSIQVGWDGLPADETHMIIGWSVMMKRPDSSSAVEVYRGLDNSVMIPDVSFGQYVFTVQSLNSLGMSSVPAVLYWDFDQTDLIEVLPPTFVGVNDA